MKDEPAENPIKKVFELNPGAIFVRGTNPDRAYSYVEFAGAAKRIGAALGEKGVGRGDMVAIFLDNCVGYLTLYLALFMQGAVAVPIDINKGDGEISEALGQIRIKAAVCRDGDAKKFSKYTEAILTSSQMAAILDGDLGDEHGWVESLDGIDYDQLSLVTFTSGSTGIPKGVKHSIKNLVLSAEAFGKKLGFGSENVFYHNLPMSYMAGILNLFILPMVSGSRIVVGERFAISSIPNFWKLPSRYEANTFWFIPAVISLLMKLDRGREGVEYAKGKRITGCVGTAPLSPALKKEFEGRYGIELYESYGLSETLFVSSSHPGIMEPCVGKPLDGVKLEFAGDGEILIGVPWMFLGYTNERIEDYMVSGRYRSGDIGMIDADGLLHITGRKKDLIKKGGLNLSPRKIESEAESAGFFEECAVIGMPDRTLMERVVCFFVPVAGAEIAKAKKVINRGIEKRLGRDYMVDEFIQIEEMPRNINGKIDKNALRKIYGGMFDNKN